MLVPPLALSIIRQTFCSFPAVLIGKHKFLSLIVFNRPPDLASDCRIPMFILFCATTHCAYIVLTIPCNNTILRRPPQK